jgi:hypothetical protein
MHRFFGRTLATLGGTALLLAIGLTPVGASNQISFWGYDVGAWNPAGNQNHIHGTGVATYLGLSVVDGNISPTGGATCGGFTATGSDVLTGANGDTLNVTTSETYCPDSTHPGYTMHGVGSYAITGGTGRFKGATGSGDISCYGDMSHPTVGGAFTINLTGTISN